MNQPLPQDIIIYNKLTSPRIWFIIILVLLIFLLIKTDKVTIGQNNIIDKNQKNTNISHHESIKNLNLIINSWQIYASPIDTRQTRSQNISSLGKNISIRMYNITDQNIIQKLKQLASDHNISIIYETKKFWEKKPTEDYIRLTNSLKSAGINIYTDDQMWVNFTHAKTTVGENWYIVQTMNWTKSSFDKNREFVFLGTNIDIKNSLTYIFAKDLSGQQIKVSDIHPNLLICPIDCRSKLEYMIQSATSSIYIYNQYIDDPSIINLLKQKISRNIDTKIILAKWPKDQQNINNFGDNFKSQSNPYPHAKVLLIDHKYLIITSINFSTNSMDNNREIWIITMDKSAISKFEDIFYQDWQK